MLESPPLECGWVAENHASSQGQLMLWASHPTLTASLCVHLDTSCSKVVEVLCRQG